MECLNSRDRLAEGPLSVSEALELKSRTYYSSSSSMSSNLDSKPLHHPLPSPSTLGPSTLRHRPTDLTSRPSNPGLTAPSFNGQLKPSFLGHWNFYALLVSTQSCDSSMSVLTNWTQAPCGQGLCLAVSAISLLCQNAGGQRTHAA